MFGARRSASSIRLRFAPFPGSWMTAEAARPPGLEKTTWTCGAGRRPASGRFGQPQRPRILLGQSRRGRWGSAEPLRPPRSHPHLRAAGLAFVDMDGSGYRRLMVANKMSSAQGYYENGGREGWSPFVAFPASNRSDAGLDRSEFSRLTDVDGDGLSMPHHNARAIVCWRNLGRLVGMNPARSRNPMTGCSTWILQTPTYSLRICQAMVCGHRPRSFRPGGVLAKPGRGRFGERASDAEQPSARGCRMTRFVVAARCRWRRLCGPGSCCKPRPVDLSKSEWRALRGSCVVESIPRPLPGTVRGNQSQWGRRGAGSCGTA